MAQKQPKIDSAILQWSDKLGLLNSNGGRFEWASHSFLLEPVSDWSQYIAIRKSAQIGFSESFGILKTIYAAKNYDWHIIYTLPTDRMSETFVTTKFDPILNYNPKLGAFVGGTTTIKKVGNRFIYFAGTHSTKGKGKEAETEKGISWTADLRVHDEMDRSDQNTIEQYSSRTENSKYAGMWGFSNPTYPGVGTDGLYEESDQKMWFVKCRGCGHWQYLDWVKVDEVEGKQDFCLIDPRGEIFVCSNCGKEITDTDRLRGEWVAKYPEREISGYWMSQLNYIQHRLSGVRGLLRKERTSSKQYFYNFVLGKPYRGTDEVVDRNVIVRNILPTLNSKKDVVMGVDQGIKKHYVIGNAEGIFEIGVTKNWDVIEQKIRDYNIRVTVIDALPYPNFPKKLIKKYPGRVFMCYYMKDKDDGELVKFLKGKDRGVVKVQRTKYLDALVDKFTQEEKPINIIQKDLEEFIKHWETLSRQEIEDNMGIIRGEWVSSNGNDHFAHATLYQDVAMSKLERGGGGDVAHPIIREKKNKSFEVSDRLTVSSTDWKNLVFEKEGLDWRYT